MPSRIDLIGQNGNTGEHYSELECPLCEEDTSIITFSLEKVCDKCKNKLMLEQEALSPDSSQTKEVKKKVFRRTKRGFRRFKR